jgi:hypothetical protein
VLATWGTFSSPPSTRQRRPGEIERRTTPDVVIAPETPHRFTATADERLVAACIHASDRFIIEWLGDASRP